MKRQIILTLLIFSIIISKSQTVRNVNFTVQGSDIQITYDLLDNGKGKMCFIELYYSCDNGLNWQGPINKNVSGDIGANISFGNGKKIVWQPLLTLSWLYSDYVMFKVVVTRWESEFTETIAGIDIEMVFVEGGTYTMGCTSEQGSNCTDDEKPAHSVTLDDYYIGKYEITQTQWRAIMGSDPAVLYFKGCDNCPVERVSWNDIQEFLSKLNSLTGKKYSLPTEAQWEYAARGGSTGLPTTYSGSNDIGSVAWYYENSGSKTHPVGQKQPNELGIYDMSGNVWEWCSDWYSSYSSSSQTNPVGASSGSSRVLRGGSWHHYAGYCRVSDRGYYSPDSRNDSCGFRVVLSP